MPEGMVIIGKEVASKNAQRKPKGECNGFHGLNGFFQKLPPCVNFWIPYSLFCILHP